MLCSWWHAQKWIVLHFEDDIFSCDQAAVRTLLSACSSVCPSVCLTPFSQCSFHHIIVKFSGVITIDRSDVHAKGQGQRSKQILLQFEAFADRNSSLNLPMAVKWCTKLEAAYKRCPVVFQDHLLNFKVTWDKKLLVLNRFRCLGCNSSLNSQMVTKWCTKLEEA